MDLERICEIRVFPFAVEQHGVSTVIEAALPNVDRGPIRVTSVGLGPDAPAAAVDGAHQWSVGVLPVLHSFILRDEDLDDVEVAAAVVGGHEKKFGWRLHLGPVIHRVFGAASRPSLAEEPDRFEAFRPVNDSLRWKALADRSSPMWIESFVIRHSDKTLDATCRLDNQDFRAGEDALMSWAASWPDPGASTVSRRQFVLARTRAAGRGRPDRPARRRRG